MDFESVDAALDAALTSTVSLKAAEIQSAEGKLVAVCETWRAARPVYLALIAIPFLPRRWREVAQMLATVLDGLCPA